MLITLARTGGIIPMTKKAEKDVDWSKKDLEELLKQIKTQEDTPGKKRDATNFQLSIDEETFSIDWEKIPAKFKKTFEEMKDNLKIVKT